MDAGTPETEPKQDAPIEKTRIIGRFKGFFEGMRNLGRPKDFQVPPTIQAGLEFPDPPEEVPTYKQKDFLGHRSFRYDEHLSDMDPEEARERAKEFAQTEKELADFFESVDLEFAQMGQPLTENSYLLVSNWDAGIVYEKGLKGLGSGNITFDHQYGTFGHHYAGYLGMKGVVNVLNISLHTDEKTMQETEKVYRALREEAARNPNFWKERFWGPHTIFAFDEQGRFGKLYALPGEVKDDRTPVQVDFTRRKPDTKYVVGEMTPLDFEMVDHALQLLKEEVGKIEVAEPAEDLSEP